MKAPTQRSIPLVEDEVQPADGAYTLRMTTLALLLLLEAGVFLAAVYILAPPFHTLAQRQLAAIQTGREQAEAEVRQLRNQLDNLTVQLQKNVDIVAEAKALKLENDELQARMNLDLGEVNLHPYEAVTGSRGHRLPPKYGHVQEKTIWSFWFNPSTCPSSQNCVLPPQVQLCTETILKNRGGFDFKIIHKDEVDEYVSRIELPFRWDDLPPELQKDSLMNALLARYGGVAMDISTVLLRPIDDYWDEMVAKGATFRGYVYRLDGRPWRHSETAAVWFMMSRREGIFSTAVRNQVVGMGDSTDPRVYSFWYNAFGDQTLAPLLHMYNYGLPKCIHDTTVINGLHADGRYMCPEHEQKPWWTGITGPPKNDTWIMVSDPREGPQLPFACLDSEVWSVSSHKPPSRKKSILPKELWEDSPGAPLYKVNCKSQKECWDNYFMAAYLEKPRPGEAHRLSFVKMFHGGGKTIKELTREQILSRTDTWFYNWLKIAGLPGL